MIPDIQIGSLVLIAVLGVVALALIIVFLNFGSIWLRAIASGASVGLVELVALWLRNLPVGLVVDNRITAVKSGIPLTIDDLSTHYLAGGNIDMVVQAGLRNIWLNCACDWGRSDPLAVPRTAVEMARRGHSTEAIDHLVYGNPLRFLSQNPRFQLA